MASAESFIPSRGIDSISPLARALALTPEERKRLVADGFIKEPAAEIIQFPRLSPRADPKIHRAAKEYLDMADPLSGTVRVLADRYGVNYQSLVNCICTMRAARRNLA